MIRFRSIPLLSRRRPWRHLIQSHWNSAPKTIQTDGRKLGLTPSSRQLPALCWYNHSCACTRRTMRSFLTGAHAAYRSFFLRSDHRISASSHWSRTSYSHSRTTLRVRGYSTPSSTAQRPRLVLAALYSVLWKHNSLT